MGERDESEVVVAIEGDGEMWCLSCAKQRYGETCVEALVGLMPGCEQSIDQWGNQLYGVLCGSEFLHGMDCSACEVHLCDADCSCFTLAPDGYWDEGVNVC